MRLICTLALVLGILLTIAARAQADVTAFIGTTSTPSDRQVRGVAFGGGVLALGFEFEYSDTREDAPQGLPSLRTGMGNILLQTPIFFAGFQPYFTTGAGVYRESLNATSETQIGGNAGGGVKWKVAGPLRLRVDYRLFKLRGQPLYGTVHRVYAGVNLAF